jgi:hypothetical protein
MNPILIRRPSAAPFSHGQPPHPQNTGVPPSLRALARRPESGRYGTAVTPAERRQRYGHRPAVVVSRSAPMLFALQRALFERAAAVTVLQDLPAPELLQDLLANGLIVLAPPASTAHLDGVAWIEVVSEGSPKESVRAVLRELERRDVLLSRDFVSPGEGI